MTVEAEPREGGGSPGKKARRSTSPTKKSTSTSTTTIMKKSVPLKVESPAKGDMSGITRKRKGTPIRRGRSTRHQPPTIPTVEPIATTVENDFDGDVILQDIDMPPPPRPSANRRTSGRIGRLNSQSAPTLRSQRLSLAREELDIALQDAVGYGEEHTLLGEVDFGKSMRLMGDATLGRNEDFSMISVETLQTAKDSSLLGNSRGSGLGDSQGSASGLGNSQGSASGLRNTQGSASGLGNSQGSASGYMASSPPKRDVLRRSVLGDPVQFGRRSTLGQSGEFGRGGAFGSASGSPSEPGNSSRRNGADVMSWRATGPAVVVRHETPSSQLKPDVQMRRSTGSQPKEASKSYGMDGADDEEDISQGIELDIWQDEASRSLEEQPEEEDAEVNVEEREAEDDEHALQAEDQLQSDAAAQVASHSPGLEDLFADQPLKPARGKIPKTWRRSSGMDFSYVDSPAHGLAEQPAEQERRHSTDGDGSGVLTPPSTSEDEEDGVDEAVTREEANERNDETIDENDERSEYDRDEPQSEWNQPDAEATRYEGQHDEQETENDKARNDSISPLSEGNTDDDDTGSFFQSNMPAVYARQSRPRRPPPRPRRDEGTVDLTDLLGLKSSPMKPAGSAAKSSHTPATSSSDHRPARTTQLYGRPYDWKTTLDPPYQHASERRPKLMESPLRRSLLKSSKMHGGSPDQKRQLQNHQVQAPAPAMKSFIVPARTQQGSRHQQQPPARPRSKDSSSAVLSPAVLDRAQTRFPNSQSKFEVELDSFASKDSDQRQLLTEMTPRIGTGVGNQHTGQSYEDDDESEEGRSSPAPVMRSYEENLNVDSPQKIPVHFGDSSSMLPPTKLFLSQAGRKSTGGNQYRPERQPVQLQQQQSQGTRQPIVPKLVPVVDRRVPTTTAGEKVGGILSRLSETFWSAVIRPTGPTEIIPEVPPPLPVQPKQYQQPAQQQKQTYQTHHHQQVHDEYDEEIVESVETFEEEEYSDEGMGLFNTTLRTAIRNRYGVLPSTFPWTMAHMRTLHRMLTSLMSSRPDSLIPNAGPLPQFLEDIVQTEQESVIGKPFVFTREHAYVVFSFLQVLVEEEVVRAMERGEVEMLGDATSRAYRGEVEGDSRKGWERVFVKKRGVGVWREEGEIGWGFVVGAVGCVVWSERGLNERGRTR